MKKIIATTACALAFVGAAFAQGNVNWGSISFAAMTGQTNSTTYSSVVGTGSSTGGGAVGGTLGTTAYYYELLVGSVYNGTAEAAPTTLASLSTWADSGLEADNNAASAGRLVPLNPNSGATVSGLSQTASNNIILVGWSANLGATWSAALAAMKSSSTLAGLSSPAFFGESAVGWVEALSTTTSPGTTLFGSSATAQGVPIFSLNTQLYELQTVPEPGTLALAALGGASLLLFRRKK